MKTWYRKISREPDELQGYLPRFNTEEREEPRPQTVASPIIDSIETSEEEPRAEKESKPTYTTSTNTTSSSFKSKNEFKATMLPIYERILSQMGLNTAYAKALVAQDGLESAWGTKPSGKFNFGGIKGKGSVKRTREVINGKDVYINDSFRDFDSLEDYAKYKISLLNNNRYKAFTGDISGFADRVFRGGYATDPKYADTLKRVIASAKHGGILKFQAGGTGETILEISQTAQNPLRSGEKAASKQLLQELVGTKDDFGLRGLSYTEKELFPKKFLSAMTQENSAKDIYSKIMSYKAEAGIRSSFTELTEAEARKIFDIGWDANMFYPTTSSNTLQTKETFWKENKDIILKLFRRVPTILGAGVLGNEVVSERNGGIIKAQDGADTRKWVDNWLSQRKDKLKNNSIYSGWLAIPGLIENPYFRQSASMSKYSFKRGKLPGKITGLTNHKEKTITTSDDSKSTEVHEWTHASRPYEQIAKVKEIIDRWGLKPGIMYDDYLDKPSEIYSRLMELRFNNNLDPNHEYTLEEVQELRNKNHTGDYLIRTENQFYKSNINNPTIPKKIEPIEKAIDMNLYKGPEELFERLDDSTIQRLLNDVAWVPKKNSMLHT